MDSGAAPPPATLTLTVANRIDALDAAMDAARGFLAVWSVSAADVSQVMVILDEVGSNIVKAAWPDGGAHAFSLDFRLEPRAEGLLLVLVAEDDGVAFDPTQRPDPDVELGLDERTPGGLGLFLVRRMAESVRYGRAEGRNRLEVRKGLRVG